MVWRITIHIVFTVYFESPYQVGCRNLITIVWYSPLTSPVPQCAHFTPSDQTSFKKLKGRLIGSVEPDHPYCFSFHLWCSRILSFLLEEICLAIFSPFLLFVCVCVFKSNLLTTDYLRFPHSLRIFSLNIEFWIDHSLLSVLCLIAVRTFLFGKFLFLLSSWIMAIDFFEFTPFPICWASWICSLMSHQIQELFSQYFPKWVPSCWYANVRPLCVVDWLFLQFSLLCRLARFCCSPSEASTLCHLCSDIKSIYGVFRFRLLYFCFGICI